VKKLLTIVFLFLILPEGKAQEKSGKTRAPLYLGGKIHYGMILPHYEELKEISEQNIWGFQFDFSKLFISEKAWSNCNCYSRIGLSFNYFDYRYPEVLGHSYNLILFFEPYLNFNSRFRTSIRAGMGLNFLDQVYDEETNPENLYYSSPISGILKVNLNLNYMIRENYQINMGLNFNHISNGGLKMPNKGMNFPTLSLGMDYILNPHQLTPQNKRPGLKSKPFHYYSRLFWSVRTVNSDENHEEMKKLMIGLEGGIIKGITNINGFLLGMEFSYDGSYREMSDRMEQNYSPYVFSLHAGHAFVIGRFSFTQQMAYYAFRDYPSTSKSFFQRYGIFYNIGKIISLGFSMKAHGHVAEHMDVRIGVEF
jgi:hypothetical protein